MSRRQANDLTADELRGEQIFTVAKQLRLACCAVASRSCSYMDVFSADQIPSCTKLCSFTGRVPKQKAKSGTKARGASVGSRPCCYRARCFIANTDPSTAPGYHWVAFVVFASRPSIIYFFDSFGMPLTSYDDLYKTCLNKGYFSDTHIVSSVNSRSLQGPASTVCGHYCILFLYLCARMSLERVSVHGSCALSAIRVLVEITGGNHALAQARDAAVVRVLNELCNRNERLVPAFACSRIGTASAHQQCCHKRN
jgi:hypothetical protein